MESLEIHPQFITAVDGQKLGVFLPLEDFDKLLDELEDQEDAKAFLEAEKEDTGEHITFAEYLNKRKEKNASL